jgi:hypothetical protein
MFNNPIDKDKVAENPGLLPYPHTLGSALVKPEDKGKLKSRALSAMEEQTTMQLAQIQRQVEVLMMEAKAIQERKSISEQIYQAELSFEPFCGHVYHLYERNGKTCLMLISPSEWGRSKPDTLCFVASVKLLSDHTWEIIARAS